MRAIRENGQGWTPLERRLAARLKRAPTGACLDFDQMVALARRGRRAPHYRMFMTHIVSCPLCRRSYLQIRAVVQTQQPCLTRHLNRWLRWKR